MHSHIRVEADEAGEGRGVLVEETVGWEVVPRVGGVEVEVGGWADGMVVAVGGVDHFLLLAHQNSLHCLILRIRDPLHCLILSLLHY